MNIVWFLSIWRSSLRNIYISSKANVLLVLVSRAMSTRCEIPSRACICWCMYAQYITTMPHGAIDWGKQHIWSTWDIAYRRFCFVLYFWYKRNVVDFPVLFERVERIVRFFRFHFAKIIYSSALKAIASPHSLICSSRIF